MASRRVPSPMLLVAVAVLALPAAAAAGPDIAVRPAHELPVELIRPLPGEVLVGGREVTVEWRPLRVLETLGIDEWEAFLSFDGGRDWPVRNGFTLNIGVTAVTQAMGDQLAATPGLVMRLRTDTFRGIATTSNVLAESPEGDPNNVVMAGAHLDSVNAGPGIQDNGSGSAAILEVAEQMAKVKPRNKVRFAWWGAEESGLVCSTYYVNNLPAAELAKITLYLNFDMIGSPNHVFFIYDGDDSDAVGAPAGAAGSAQIEKSFESYFNMLGKPFKGTDFSGRSDYGPFILASLQGFCICKELPKE